MMNFRARRAIHLIGSGLALVGIIFLGLRLYSYWIDLDFSHFTRATWIVIVSLILLYSLANVLLSFAWRSLLTQFGIRVTCWWSMKIYGMSQIAKYIPGNIFHLAGRQAMGMAAGVPAVVLAKSVTWELGLIAVAGSIYSCLVIPLLFKIPWVGSLILFFMTVLVIAYLLFRFVGIQVAVSLGWQMFFLAISAGIFTYLLSVVSSRLDLGVQIWLSIGGAYIVAWLVGLVTPGAPAGVGIRELILLLLLKHIVIESDLIMTVLLGRMITVIGDFLFFVVSVLTPSRHYISGKNYG
jgi:Uncharacterised protein family (UPF0104).